MKTMKPRHAALLTALSAIAAVAGQPVDQYQVKAAFVFNFARFVEWPAEDSGNPADPFAICILGRNPFGSFLETMVEGKNIDGRPFAVRQLAETFPHTASG